MLRAPIRYAISAALLVSVAESTAAQTVRGEVSDSIGGAPLPSAVVQLIGADGRVLARSISNASGTFRLTPSQRAVELRVVRIGYRPLSLPLSALADGDLQLRLRMQRVQAYARPIRVLALQCRRRRGRESPVQLIEQARAGLLSNLVSRESNPAAMRRYYYTRWLAAASDTILHQQVELDSAQREEASFRAAQDADEFVRRGFADLETGEWFGPDAEVLLDDRFASGYCFRQVPATRERPHQVGLGFEPADRRRGRVDIEGTLWIDTLARELRDIEFRYLGLDKTSMRFAPGGRVKFRALSNGIVVVESWSLYVIARSVDAPPVRSRELRPVTRMHRQETGGQLVSASWSDGTSFAASLGTIRGQVRSHAGDSTAGVTVALMGSPFTAVTDTAGRFVIADVLPGIYPVLAIDPQLATLQLPLTTRSNVRSDLDSISVTFTVPTARELAMELCVRRGQFEENSKETFALGRAMSNDGHPVKHAEWTLRLHRTANWSELVGWGRTSADGLMGICASIEPGMQMDLSVISLQGEVTTVSRVFRGTSNVIPVVVERPAKPR